jgi:hypothetical protein
MSANADTPCCPCCNDQHNYQSSIVCALKCINFAGAVLPTMIATRLHFTEVGLPSIANGAMHGHAPSPPTHPPPV